MFDITAIITHIKKGSVNVGDPHIMNVTRDWMLAIVLFLMVSLCGGMYLYFLHTTYQATTLDTLLSEVKPVPYQSDTVQQALRIVSEKQTKFNNITISDSVVVPMAIESEENNEDEFADSSDELDNAVEDILLENDF